MTLTDADMATLLAPAGLRFIKRMNQEDVRLPPLPPGHSAASAGPEHGRFDSRPDEIPDVDDTLTRSMRAGSGRRPNMGSSHDAEHHCLGQRHNQHHRHTPPRRLSADHTLTIRPLRRLVGLVGQEEGLPA